MNTYQPIATLQANQIALETLREKFNDVASDINLSSKDWRGLMESGALASLSISRYRGHKQLSAVDLGISQDEYNQVESIVNLGYRLLLPKTVLGQFNSLETRARQVLRQYTLKVPSGYFLPVSAWDACAAAMQDHKLRFESLVEQLLVELPVYRDQIRDQYTTLASQVARRLYNASIITYAEIDAYSDDFMARCMATFPLDSELRGQFRFDLRLAFVPLPYQTSQAETPAYANPSNDLIALRKAVIAEQSQIQNDEIRGFVSAIQSEIYGLVNEGLTNVLASIQDKGFLQSRSSVQLRGLVERLAQLNFWDDAKLNLIKAEITQILDREPSKRDMALNTSLLSEIQTQAATMLLQLGTLERGDFNMTAETPKLELTKPSQPPIKMVFTPAASQPQPAAPMLATSRNEKRLF